VARWCEIWQCAVASYRWAPTRKKQDFPVSYPKLIHFICVTHALHRVCETSHVLYPNVDKLVANWKKIFVKSPARTELFKNKAPDIPLPPTPVITQ
jgi:hypothetical protein